MAIQDFGNARAFARDYARDHLPSGFLWDIVDFVPAIIDAQLTSRGGWIWGSTPMGGDPETGIYATFTNGEKTIVQAANGHLYDVADAPPYTATDRGAIARAKQNPIQLYDTVIHFDKTGATVPTTITNPGGVLTPGTLHATAPKATIGATWQQDMIVVGGVPGAEDTVYFSDPDGIMLPFDPTSAWKFPLAVKALMALRSVLLVFHAGQVSRLRGVVPPHGEEDGDMDQAILFDKVGSVDPLSITRWLDNCVFADEHGVHITDGAVVRNIVNQGAIQYYWRVLWGQKTNVCATVFLDYYIITLTLASGPPVTLVCDLNKRQWFRFSNIGALTYFSSSGGTNMERVWAGQAGTNRLIRLGPCFFPVPGVGSLHDDDGDPVLPFFETGWNRINSEEGRKRIRFGYLSYDARLPSAARDSFPRPDQLGLPQEIPPESTTALAATPLLELGYITSPQETNYVVAGKLPDTTRYTRYRLPIGRQPYGIAFRVRQIAPSSVTRIFNLGVDGQATERSRV